MQRRNEEEDAKRKKVLSEDEVRTLREGLLKKLEQLKYSYGQITHKKKYDTLVLLRKKEGLEKEMATIEKDLQLLNNKGINVQKVRTRFRYIYNKKNRFFKRSFCFNHLLIQLILQNTWERALESSKYC